MIPCQTTTYLVEGLCCADEEYRLRKHLGKLNGVSKVSVNIINCSVSVRHSCSREDLVKKIHDAGFKAYLKDEKKNKKPDRKYLGELFFTVFSGVLFVAGLFADYAGAIHYITIPIFAAAILSGGWKIAVKGFHSLRRFSLDMNFLMMGAAIGAIALGKWEEGAAVVVLFSVSLLIESYSVRRTRKSITDLMNVAPPTATVLRNGAEVKVSVKNVLVGETIAIRPGERIPVDGKITGGESSVNQAPITGESIPVVKRLGDSVYAGSLNERGYLEIVSEKPYYDTVISRIVRKVEEAQSERAPIQTITEKFARYYTPAVFALAVLMSTLPPLFLGGVFSEWLYRSLVILVIACPCALVISTPVTIISGLANAAKNGVLIKSGRILEGINTLKVLAFDKTGTLTQGKPKVTDIIPMNNLSPKKIMEISAAVEYRSEHSLAGAILKRAYEDNLIIDPPTYQHFESLTGKGVQMSLNDQTYYLGNRDLIHEQNICTPELLKIVERLESTGKTVIILGTDKEALGVIGIQDQLRMGGKEAVRLLRIGGIEKIIMLTGDNDMVAAGIAKDLGLDDFHAGILPEEKLAHVNRLKASYGDVAMVGDGINDAPALAAANVGIAMGGSGTDIALETADVVLMSDDLYKLPFLRDLGRRTYNIIIQNIILSLSTKILFLILGSLGIATLWIAILADDGAALLVIFNGLRILKFPCHKNPK